MANILGIRSLDHIWLSIFIAILLAPRIANSQCYVDCEKEYPGLSMNMEKRDYLVHQGNTKFTIAQLRWGNDRFWPLIEELNFEGKSLTLVTGKRLYLPAIQEILQSGKLNTVLPQATTALLASYRHFIQEPIKSPGDLAKQLPSLMKLLNILEQTIRSHAKTKGIVLPKKALYILGNLQKEFQISLDAGGIDDEKHFEFLQQSIAILIVEMKEWSKRL